MSSADIREVGKEKYGEAALRVKGRGSVCCGSSSGTSYADPITSNLYDGAQTEQLPEEALLASLVYRVEDAREFRKEQNIDVDALAPQVDGKFMSAFVRAVKPVGKEPCCAPTCCN